MSAKLMGAVWDLSLSHGKQIVLLALADHAHDDGTHCYPGIPYLAWKTGYTERNVTRILSDLEEDEIIESEGKEGGRGRFTGYTLTLQKGDKKDEYKPRQVRQRVTSQTKKGDKSALNPDKSDKKGDKSPRANIEEPSLEPSEEPSGEERARETPLPDDTTTQCLLTLKKVKGIGKDYGELAVLLGELREEFPQVDAVATVKEYELFHRRPPKPTKNHALKLRTFFKNAEKWRDDSAPKTNGSKKAEKDYSWLEAQMRGERL